MAELFPEDVRRFVDDHVESVDQLEILRLLWEKPDCDWSEGALAAEIQISPREAAAHLTALQSRGLLRSEMRESAILYQHGAHDADTDALLRKMLQHYRERPVSMIKLVTAQANNPLRSFADAFRVRPKEGG